MTEPMRLQPNSSATCPECATVIPVYSDYVTWCDACGWNVNPRADRTPSGPFARLYARLGQRVGAAMLRDMAEAGLRSPGLSGSVLAAGAMALLVHMVTLGLVVGSLRIMSTAWPNAFLIVIGAGGLLMAWLLRPDLGHVPEAHYTRERLPHLFALLDRVAAAIGGRSPEVVLIDGAYNASFGRMGLRQTRVMSLGLPLVAGLEPKELVALLGHELGHGVNGDAARSLAIGSALRTLESRHWMLQPNWDQGGLLGVAGLPVFLLAVCLRWVLRLYGEALVHLLFRQSQRAEYRADILAGGAAGTDAAIHTLEKCSWHTAFTWRCSAQRWVTALACWPTTRTG